MSANQDAKKEIVAEIEEKIKSAKSVVVTHYTGMTVKDDSDVRAKMRKADVEYKVYKNTLVKKAFENLGISDFDNVLSGPTAFAFAKDETAGAKIVVAAAKDYTDKVVPKCAYIEGKFVDEKGVMAYAAIPAREELYAKLAGSLKQIIGGLAVALQAVATQKTQG